MKIPTKKSFEVIYSVVSPFKGLQSGQYTQDILAFNFIHASHIIRNRFGNGYADRIQIEVVRSKTGINSQKYYYDRELRV